MKTRHLISSALVVLTLSASAFAGNRSSDLSFETFYDDGGMPRCIERRNGDRPASLFFYWKRNDRYGSKVKAILSERSAYLENTIPGTARENDCRTWRESLNREKYGKRVFIEPGDESVLGFPLEPAARLALLQASLGATVIRPEMSSAEFLKRNPIQDFDLKTNRKLTARYGVGFTSELYREWIGSNPVNAEFRDQVLQALGQPETNEALRDQIDRYTFVIAPNLGNDGSDEDGGRMKSLISAFRDLGIRYTMLKIHAQGTVKGNGALEAEQLDDILSRGEQIVVIAASKGFPDVMAALNTLSPKLNDPMAQAKGYGQMVGFLNISGVVTGSFIVDWAKKTPLYLLAKMIAASGLEPFGFTREKLDSFTDLSSSSMRKIVAEYASSLPRNAVYLSVVGTMPGDGTGNDSLIANLQKNLIRKFMSGYGANDGYIEYPGTVIPDSWNLDQRTLVFNASHMALDGEFAGLDLQDSKNAVDVIRAFTTTFIRLIETKQAALNVAP